MYVLYVVCGRLYFIKTILYVIDILRNVNVLFFNDFLRLFDAEKYLFRIKIRHPACVVRG